jgi:phosphoglycerol transferase MdoB-like AlkP superfamily enzyme
MKPNPVRPLALRQEPATAALRGYPSFLFHFLKSVKQWLLFMLYLTAFRAAFIYLFRNKMDQTSSSLDVMSVALNGMRFDSVIATYMLLIPFLVATAPRILKLDRIAPKFSEWFGRVFIGLTSIVWAFTFVYFKEYDQQFNLYIFNLYYDDTTAILQTIWSAYHPVVVFLLIVLVSWVLLAMRKKFTPLGDSVLLRLSRRKLPLAAKSIVVTLCLLALIFASRGTFDARPIQPQDVGVVADTYLNKTVLNPYFSLLYAVQDHLTQTGTTGLAAYLPDGNIRRAVNEVYQQPADPNNLDAYLEKHAKGPKGGLPRHIFLILMESYDSWALLPKYAPLGLTTQLTSIGKEGIYINRFLPSSSGTSEAFCVLTTQLPYPELKVNYQYSAKKPYPSSLFATFKRLGYRTRLFYGGNLTWQRFGEFAQDQGADEVYGAPHMNKGRETHEWGVDDEYLFAFIEKTIADDRPSFNFVLNTSYHPPFNVDVRAKGFSLKKIPDELASSYDGSMSLTMLGHLWYADKCLGDFTHTMEKKLPNALFAYTGDHFGRRFINDHPDYFERSSVPFMLYGKTVLKGVTAPENVSGSHVDVGATLIELAAPKGFTYYSAGQDLLAQRKEYLGIGWWRMIGKDFLFDIASKKFYPLPGQELPKVLPDPKRLANVFSDVHGIGWWRVKKGAALP